MISTNQPWGSFSPFFLSFLPRKERKKHFRLHHNRNKEPHQLHSFFQHLSPTYASLLCWAAAMVPRRAAILHALLSVPECSLLLNALREKPTCPTWIDVRDGGGCHNFDEVSTLVVVEEEHQQWQAARRLMTRVEIRIERWRRRLGVWCVRWCDVMYLTYCWNAYTFSHAWTHLEEGLCHWRFWCGVVTELMNLSNQMQRRDSRFCYCKALLTWK